MAEVLKCSCSTGTQQVLDVLRGTSLASLPVEDWNMIVGAVNKAGGINADLFGYPRAMLQKAVVDYNTGVAKGDYVGHPFRGNQWSDSSGAATGGAGGKPSEMAGLDPEEKRIRQLEESGMTRSDAQGVYDIEQRGTKARFHANSQAAQLAGVSQNAQIALNNARKTQNDAAKLVGETNNAQFTATEAREAAHRGWIKAIESRASQADIDAAENKFTVADNHARGAIRIRIRAEQAHVTAKGDTDLAIQYVNASNERLIANNVETTKLDEAGVSS